MGLRKLTLSIDEDIIEQARRYSDKHDTSISRLVSNYLEALGRDEPRRLSPTVRRLIGILPADVTRDEYRGYLGEKHAL